LDRDGQQFFVTESFVCAPPRTRSAAGRLMWSKIRHASAKNLIFNGDAGLRY